MEHCLRVFDDMEREEGGVISFLNGPRHWAHWARGAAIARLRGCVGH